MMNMTGFTSPPAVFLLFLHEHYFCFTLLTCVSSAHVSTFKHVCSFYPVFNNRCADNYIKLISLINARYF